MLLLYSGGMDSYIGWHYLGKPKTLYVNLYHKYATFEMHTVLHTIPQTKIVNQVLNLSQFEKEDADIPWRNAFLILVACLYREKDESIGLVVQKGEMSILDRSETFFNMMSNLIRLESPSYYPSCVHLVFPHMTKTQMVEWYLNKVGDVESLLKTRSCYGTELLPCGACGACFRRWVALENNGLKEEYLTNPWETPLAQKYLAKMKTPGVYDAERVTETLNAFSKVGVNINQ